MGKVKEKTLRKVEEYFARQSMMRGSPEIQVTLEDLRKETQLSLVTLYKALDDLMEDGILMVVDQGTRRSPKIYRYIAGIRPEEKNIPPSDLTGLTKAVEELVRELSVKERVVEALRAKLFIYEAQESNVLYRLNVTEDLEVIVRKKGLLNE